MTGASHDDRRLWIATDVFDLIESEVRPLLASGGRLWSKGSGGYPSSMSVPVNGADATPRRPVRSWAASPGSRARAGAGPGPRGHDLIGVSPHRSQKGAARRRPPSSPQLQAGYQPTGGVMFSVMGVPWSFQGGRPLLQDAAINASSSEKTRRADLESISAVRGKCQPLAQLCLRIALFFRVNERRSVRASSALPIVDGLRCAWLAAS
jgi:hypothetical protein